MEALQKDIVLLLEKIPSLQQECLRFVQNNPQVDRNAFVERTKELSSGIYSYSSLSSTITDALSHYIILDPNHQNHSRNNPINKFTKT